MNKNKNLIWQVKTASVCEYSRIQIADSLGAYSVIFLKSSSSQDVLTTYKPYLPTWHKMVVFTHMTQKCLFFLPMWHKQGCIYQQGTERSYLPTLHRKVVFTHMTQKCLFYQCNTKRLHLSTGHRKVIFDNLTQKGCIYQHDTEMYFLPMWHKKGCIYQHGT